MYFPMDPEALLDVLGNKYSPEILMATADPRTAQELSEELGSPIATCDRRLEDLSEHGVVEQTGTKATEKNRHAKLFQRRIERVCFDVDEEISAQLTERSDVDSKLDEIWQRIRR